MKLKKKVTDFIKLEEGNIGHKAAVTTGAILASTVLGALLASPVQAGTPCHCNYDAHSNWYSTCGGACWMHSDIPHYNVSGDCSVHPLPC